MQPLKNDQKTILGVTALIEFNHPQITKPLPARIDTGARTSSLWASHITADDQSVSFHLFDESHPDYTGKNISLPIVEIRTVVSSMGHSQDRYVVELPIKLAGNSFNSQFTLSNRSTQTYPILIGRRTLAGKFLVDCGIPGDALATGEKVEFET